MPKDKKHSAADRALDAANVILLWMKGKDKLPKNAGHKAFEQYDKAMDELLDKKRRQR